MSDHFLREHLRSVPMHRVILRAIECKLYAQFQFAGPILDVGCGDGHFAQVLFSTPLDFGIDPSSLSLAEAAERNAYRRLAVASACDIPFPDSSFNTVISNCVVEHIPEIKTALGEINRVLVPGGSFALTVPSHRFADFLLGSGLLRRLGLGTLGDAYGRWFDSISRHHHRFSREGWSEMLEEAGFGVVSSSYYMSERAMHFFDLSHYFSAPSLITRKLIGRWVLFPNKTSFLPLEKWLDRFYNEPEPEVGAYVFFLCRKQGKKQAMGSS
ncbi:MAG: class I SAM-dependent methyltransferase [Chloroflexi bacterium]|nr:class I SAM-dependent methyltransferase [Chloroflexota bacterium]